MDLGWEITAKNGRTVSVEPPQDSKLLGGKVYLSSSRRVRRVCVAPPARHSLHSLLCNETRRA